MDKIKIFLKNNIHLKDNPIYANPLKRAASFIVDLLIIVILFNGFISVAKYFGYDTKIYEQEMILENNIKKDTDILNIEKNTDNTKVIIEEDINKNISGNLYFSLLIVSSLYFIIFLSSKKQATIGNQIFKIMVVHTKKAKVSPLTAFLRYISTLLNNTIYGIGYLCYFFNKDQAFLQDLLSDTRVINVKTN